MSASLSHDSIQNSWRAGLVILGCGWIARRHAAAARRLGVPLLFASRDLARARAYARAFGAADAFGALRARRARSSSGRRRDLHAARSASRRHPAGASPRASTCSSRSRSPDAGGGRPDDRGRAAPPAASLMVAENFRFMPAFRRVNALLDRGRARPAARAPPLARGYRQHSGWRLGRCRRGRRADRRRDPLRARPALVGRRRAPGLRAAPSRRRSGLGGEDAVDLLAELAGGGVGLPVQFPWQLAAFRGFNGPR